MDANKIIVENQIFSNLGHGDGHNYCGCAGQMDFAVAAGCSKICDGVGGNFLKPGILPDKQIVIVREGEIIAERWILVTV